MSSSLQLQHLAPAVIVGAGVFAMCETIMTVAGLADLPEWFLSVLGLALMCLSVSPHLFFKNDVPAVVREKMAVAGLLAWIVLLRASICVWKTPMVCFISGHGHTAMLTKMFLVVLHISDRDFWILNIVDSALWVFNGFCQRGGLRDSQEVQEFMAFLAVTGWLPLLLGAGIRQLPIRTLAAVEMEGNLRAHAESARQGFLSYIMHEMRNPLSGTSLLIFEFVESLRDLAHASLAASKGGGVDFLQKKTKEECARLRELATCMKTQVDKMKSVCDDVLQLEKITKGGFEYEFIPRVIEEWAQTLGSQSALIFSRTEKDLTADSPGGLVRRGDSHWSLTSVSSVRSGASSNTPSRSPSRSKSGSCPSRSPSVVFGWSVAIDPEIQAVMTERPAAVADFARLDQVVGNFLSNAKKFTKRGSVHLKFELLPTASVSSAEMESPSNFEESKQWQSARQFISQAGEGELHTSKSLQAGDELPHALLRVSVIDSGPGLSEEDKGKLFRPYGQVRAGELQNGGGTGLGLCICKNFVEAHMGGRVQVESAGRDQGSTFSFEILVPLCPAPPPPMGSPTRVLRNLNIAAPTEVKVKAHASSSPRASRSDCSHAESGKEASSHLVTSSHRRGRTLSEDTSEPASSIEDSTPYSHTRPKQQKFKPSQSGSAAEVGNSSDGKPDRRASAVSFAVAGGCQKAEGGKERRGRDKICFRRSVSDFVSAPEPVQPPTADRMDADVLLVDDDRFCLMAGSAAIKRLGFTVKTVEDGEDAVDLIVHQKASFRFVITDKNMCQMEGPEAIRQMVAHFSAEKEREQAQRGDGEKEGCPFFIGYTGDAGPEACEVFFKAGAHRVIFKPLNPSQLKETLRELEESETELEATGD